MNAPETFAKSGQIITPVEVILLIIIRSVSISFRRLCSNLISLPQQQLSLKFVPIKLLEIGKYFIDMGASKSPVEKLLYQLANDEIVD